MAKWNLRIKGYHRTLNYFMACINRKEQFLSLKEEQRWIIIGKFIYCGQYWQFQGQRTIQQNPLTTRTSLGGRPNFIKTATMDEICFVHARQTDPWTDKYANLHCRKTLITYASLWIETWAELSYWEIQAQANGAILNQWQLTRSEICFEIWKWVKWNGK